MRGLKRHLDDGGNTSTLVIWGTWQIQVSPGRERSYKRILSCRMECAMPLDRYEHWRGWKKRPRECTIFFIELLTLENHIVSLYSTSGTAPNLLSIGGMTLLTIYRDWTDLALQILT